MAIERFAILGGSSVYTPELILSIISHNVHVKEIVLIGRSERKLSVVVAFCRRLFNKTGFPVHVEGTTNVKQGVAGATYVLNNIRVGGMKARIQDERLPPLMGMIGDECVGAGGFANAMRTLPVVLQYAEMIEKANPNALLINLTNPVGICVEALLRYSKLKVVGVTDLPGVYIKKIAEVLEHDESQLVVHYVGLNHMGWIQDVKINGYSQMARLLERLEKHEVDGFDFELIELFRMIPTRQLALYFHQDAILKKQRAIARSRVEVLHEAEEQILELYADERLSDIPELTRARNALWYDRAIVPLIQALESKDDKTIILCVRNEGHIRDLPDDCSVEIPVFVSKKGLNPRRVGSCPRLLRGLFLAFKESDRLTIEAVRHKSYDCALQALTINPLVPSIDAAKGFLDRLIREEHLELH